MKNDRQTVSHSTSTWSSCQGYPHCPYSTMKSCSNSINSEPRIEVNPDNEFIVAVKFPNKKKNTP